MTTADPVLRPQWARLKPLASRLETLLCQPPGLASSDDNLWRILAEAQQTPEIIEIQVELRTHEGYAWNEEENDERGPNRPHILFLMEIPGQPDSPGLLVYELDQAVRAQEWNHHWDTTPSREESPPLHLVEEGSVPANLRRTITAGQTNAVTPLAVELLYWEE